jgi:hypothetical protein
MIQTTNQLQRPLARIALVVAGVTALWVVLALVRDGTTFHLAPLIVAGALPLMVALDLDQDRSTTALAALAALGGIVALGATAGLAAADAMAGPSLLPFGGAATESVIFSIVGTVGGFLFAAARTR